MSESSPQATGKENPDLIVRWRGEEIGVLRKPKPDMWYLDGHFAPNSSPAAIAFTTQAEQLDAKAVFAKPQSGMRVLLFDAADPADIGTHALVFSLRDHSLTVRRVCEKAGVDWLLANVKE